LNTDRRGFIGGLIALAVAPRAIAAPAPPPPPIASPFAAAPHGIVGLMDDSTLLTTVLQRTYSRRNYFAPHEEAMSVWYSPLGDE
jgi:hypothetical protein